MTPPYKTLGRASKKQPFSLSALRLGVGDGCFLESGYTLLPMKKSPSSTVLRPRTMALLGHCCSTQVVCAGRFFHAHPLLSLTQRVQGVGQFCAYLRLQEVQKMSNLRYYFDAAKGATEPFVKTQFKRMMYGVNPNTQAGELTTAGQAVFDAIWSNVALRGNLFPDDDTDADYDSAKSKFITMVSQTTNSFYNFIHIK